MNTVHPNLSVLEQLLDLIPNDLANAKTLLTDDFVWHYFNPELPDLAGDYPSVEGLQTFFQKLGTLTNNTFRVKVSQAMPIGDELVVVHAHPMMTLEGQSFETDAVVVWRVVENRVMEAWDIPAIYSMRPQIQD
ncbi:MAG: nuclear transport factor 2 family protein [Cyanobacteria bacterium P01_E01_bin.6]